jgi:hypothetical protein
MVGVSTHKMWNCRRLSHTTSLLIHTSPTFSWAVDELCAKKNCVWIYLQSLVIKAVSDYRVQLNDITSATCKYNDFQNILENAVYCKISIVLVCFLRSQVTKPFADLNLCHVPVQPVAV